MGNSHCYDLVSRAVSMSCRFGQSARSIESRHVVRQENFLAWLVLLAFTLGLALNAMTFWFFFAFTGAPAEASQGESGEGVDNASRQSRPWDTTELTSEVCLTEPPLGIAGTVCDLGCAWYVYAWGNSSKISVGHGWLSTYLDFQGDVITHPCWDLHRQWVA